MNIILDDFAFEVVLKTNVHAESDHAAAQTRSDVLSFAQAGDDVSESKAGALMIGGVDITIIPWIRLGGEVRYRRVTGVLGLAGVSAALGNHDVGGFSTALRLSLGR